MGGSALLDTNGKIRLSPVRCQQQLEIKENSTKLNQIHHLIISGRDGSKPKDKIGRADRSQEFHHLGSALQHNGNMHLIKRGREGERNEQKKQEPFKELA